MDLSIIITSYNTKDLLDQCLSSVCRTLKKSELTFEIIVIDNASTDRSQEMVSRKYPKVVCIINKENVGFGKANNLGIHKAKGEYILLLNSDTQVRNGAIEQLFSFCKTHTKSIVGPKLTNSDGSIQTSCGPFFSLPVVFAVLFLKGDYNGLTRWSLKKEQIVDWVSGACLCASKSMFFDGLLFDESIFMYMDEIDLLYRAKQKGYTVYFNPNATVMHVGSGSSTNKRKGPILNIYRGFMQFYRKFYPGWRVRVLHSMLQCKAYLGIFFGMLCRKKELEETYEEALRLV